MTLWTLIRDFLVQNIFGGTDSVGTEYVGDISGNYNSSSFMFEINGQSISIGDWLSTTFTIVTLVLFLVLLCILAKWLFKVVSGLFLLR